MQKNILPEIEKYTKQSRKRRVWMKVVSVLACVVVFCTTYALILPAITQENEVTCAIEEHKHDDECYKVIITENLICTEPEIIYHEHTDECYEIIELEDEDDGGETSDKTTENVNPEQSEAMESSVMDEVSFGAEEVSDAAEDGEVEETAVGTMDQGEDSVESIEPVKVLVCEEPEEKVHEHTEACYERIESEPVLSCELQEHVHGLACYADLAADVESAAVWEQTFADVNLTGVWSEDVISIAKTQLGYFESTKNYIVETIEDEDGSTKETAKGYTRYGAWYGNAYGDWCAMFASFCLDYAGVEGMPLEAYCPTWIQILSSKEYDLFRSPEDFEPLPGDLVFFDWDFDQEADHVGLVESIQENQETGKLQICTIEGNSANRVQSLTYDLSDSSIMGYGVLPTNPDIVPSVLTADQETEMIHEELSVNGIYYHDPEYVYYQESAQRVTGDVTTFVLVPDEIYAEEWLPNTINWSAKADANYIVTYCAERFTKVSSKGEAYDTFTIDNSRFASEELRKSLAGIIAHSYPFLTEEEMQAELLAAYENGDIQVDVSNCTASEYMAAAQGAIWQLMNPSMSSFSTFTYGGFQDDLSANMVNPLQETGCTDENDVDEHCEAIMRWLMQQSVPGDLRVEKYDYTVEKDEYELYSLTVAAEFNRAVIAGEKVSMQLTAGEQSSECMELSAGVSDFTVNLSGLTEKELLEAEVALDVSGQRMQAYFFDSDAHQDMIGGQWESYEDDISFKVADEQISVSVVKEWADGKPDDIAQVMVQLQADGENILEPVYLCDENNWSYTWGSLDKNNVLGQEIQYTIQETPVEGYYSTIEQKESETVVVPVWEQVDTLSDGQEFMLVSKNGGLAMENQQIRWAKANVEDASVLNASLIWRAQDDGNRGFYLINSATGQALSYNSKPNDYYHYILPGDDETMWMSFTLKNGVLKGKFGEYSNLDFVYLSTGGYGNVRDFSEYSYTYAEEFELYRLTDMEIPKADIAYTIENTKIKEEIKLIDVSVEKQWSGRIDDSYPDAVTVQLLQNEQAYGEPVILNKDNEWSAKWTALPETDNEGIPFEYMVKETEMDHYEPVYSAEYNEAENCYDIMIQNQWSPEKASVTLQKTDEMDNTVLLQGAKFDLYLVTNNTGVLIDNTDGVKGILVESVTVDAAEGIVLKLDVGETYYLVETKAPQGYIPLTIPIGFTVDKRGTYVSIDLVNGESWANCTAGTTPVLSVENKMGYVLPMTGGINKDNYTTTGIALMSTAIGLLYMNHIRKRRCRASRNV